MECDDLQIDPTLIVPGRYFRRGNLGPSVCAWAVREEFMGQGGSHAATENWFVGSEESCLLSSLVQNYVPDTGLTREGVKGKPVPQEGHYQK